MSNTRSANTHQSDLLLWVAGGSIAAVGAAWLVIMEPWAGPSEPPAATAPAMALQPTSVAAAAAPEPETTAAAATTLDNPLRMAALAYDAGMLVEPEEYSAWTLYVRAVRNEPGNADAVAGLTKVADDLVRRGETALAQGRFDFARSTVERIRAALPEHDGAKSLAARIWPEVAPQQPTVETPRAATSRVARVEVAPPVPARPAIDVVAEHSAAFESAMVAGRLLTPTEQSAKHFLAALVSANPEHELTLLARERLSREFLSRAAQAVEAHDGEAAGIWIDEAQAIGIDTDGVRRARAALTEHLVAMEAAKPTPASALKIVTYVAPVYPSRALDRGLEGWVDIEFTVGTDGVTRDLVVANASHDSLFRREALEAVEKWRFEPRVFMGRAIEQRSYTRIRFVE